MATIDEKFSSTLDMLPTTITTKEPKSDNGRIRTGINFLIIGLITGYFAWATQHFTQQSVSLYDTSSSGYGLLMILYIFMMFGVSYSYIIKPYLVKPLTENVWKPLTDIKNRIFEIKYVSILFYMGILILILAYLIWDAWGSMQRLVPIAGLILFLLFGYVFSKHRRQIKWQTIIWGLILQFIFGLITLRWETGRNIFATFGDKVTIFLGYAKQGSAFVYGDYIVSELQVFAFSAISTIYFLGFMINILYHCGIMQKVVGGMGTFLQKIMGTSICESVNSAANIFLGQTEAPLLLKPYLADLTASELHTIMTSGFASVSGTVLAAYISYGANAAHLITASVMAAPAGLVFSKLMYPETEETVATKQSVELTKSEFTSLLDAASQGASQATNIVLGIIANLIAFISTVYFINGVLGWMGALVGYADSTNIWTIERFVGYIFIPISFVMGVPWDQCEHVGRLIGVKMMVNEFAAFAELQKIETALEPRTKVIATFAICGFANPGSLGIMISALGTLIPNKSSIITATVFRAFVSGSIVCFTTACISGMLTE